MPDIQRGDIWWADLPNSKGSGPASTRPVLVVQSDAFNQSGIRTVLVVVLTSNPKLANMPGNIWLEASESQLPRDSVINVSQFVTLDKTELRDYVGRVSDATLELLDDGLHVVLGLQR